MENELGRARRRNDGLMGAVLRQAWTEFVVSLRDRPRFRAKENASAVSAYCAMTVAEFKNINARQRWSNWRTIPRSLQGRLPARPCMAVDLCAGVGDSTEVLASLLPSGSEVLGLEYNPEFVRTARGRTYRGSAGEPVKADFNVQSVLETFRGSSGEPLADGSADVVNCCGAIALNFDERQIDSLASEIRRVLRPGGLAAIDAPAKAAGQQRMVRLFTARRFEALGSARSCILDRFSQICFRSDG